MPPSDDEPASAAVDPGRVAAGDGTAAGAARDPRDPRDALDSLDSLDAGPGEPSDDLERLLARVATAPSVAPPPMTGDRVGRYVLLERLGAGGMGVVMAAHDPQLDRRVAIKLLHTGAVGDGRSVRQRERAVREARALARLVHPNIVAVHDAGVHRGELYIVMELVTGRSLREWLEHRPRTVAEIVGLFRQAAVGLGAAHAAGMIHRDFKPDNMLVGDDGRVRVADFGLVQLAEGGQAGEPGDGAVADVDPLALTVTHAFAGTPAYMAPEQLAGGAIDHRVDQYAFGVSLWQALYGAVPCAATSLAERRRQLAAGPPAEPPGRRVPGWLRALVRRTLAAAPDVRFPDMAAVTRALDRGGERRRRGRAAVIAGGVIAIGAVAAALAIARPAGHRAPPPWRAAVAALEPAYDENGNHNAFSPDGAWLAYDSDRERAGQFQIYVRPVAGGAERAVTGLDRDVTLFGWTADGGLLFRDRNHPLDLFRVAAGGGAAERIGSGRWVARCGDGLVFVALAPPGPGCERCNRIVVRDPLGRERELARIEGDVHDARCDPRGRRVVYTVMPPGELAFYPAGDLWLLEVATGERRQLTRDRAFNFLPVFTPDGDSVVFTSGRGGRMNLWELALAGGAAVQLTTGEGNDMGVDVAPDGRALVFNVDVTAQPLFARPTAGGGPRRVTAERLILVGLHPTPDGAEVVASDVGALIPRIVAVRVADGAVRTIADGALAAVSPDGGQVVIASGGAPARLTIGPLHGGERRPLAELDGRVFELGAGVDGYVHADLLRAGVREAWRVPLAGGPPEREAPAPWCFVQVAPTGGWRAWIQCAATSPDRHAVLARGDAPPDPTAPTFLLTVPGAFDAAGARYVYSARTAVELVELATGAHRTLFDEVSHGIAISPDGETVYSVLVIGRVRRHVVSNFADRPRPR